MKKPEIFGNSGLFIAQPGENGENSHCSVGNPNPRIRDQKAAGSNPATSTPRDIENQCTRGFVLPAGFPLFPGCNLPGYKAEARQLELFLPVYISTRPEFATLTQTGKTTVCVESGFRSAGSYKSRLRITNTRLVAEFSMIDTDWRV